MERVDLEALEAALAKATPGEWNEYAKLYNRDGLRLAKEDMDCIALAHNALPALLAEVRELRQEAERARWCQDMRADVSWSDTSRRWRVSWVAGGLFDIATDPDRNAAIDAARGGGQ